MSAPIAILISALGGEGGGVLAGWITNAAAATGLAVQRTSVPGVAQRTGATTYYLEIHPEELSPEQRADLVLSLTPMPGAVDIVLATELLETARTMQAGFVTPDRTTLIASTHRIYTIAERGAAGDGRIDPDGVFAAAGALARTSTMFDMEARAKSNDSHTNAVILGALAASGRLPIGRTAFEGAIQASGVAVDANLRGFAAGFEAAEVPPAAGQQTTGQDRAPANADADLGALAAFLPGDVASLAGEAVHRLRGYQDARYAELFLSRLRPVAELDQAAYALTKIVVRHLATMMTYEDVMRVAQLKSTRERLARVRREAGSAPGDVVRIAEYLKPGPDEFAAILPPALALRLLRWADRPGWRARLTFAMKIRTTTVWGFLQLRLLAKMRRWRRRTYGFLRQQELIERWLEDVITAARMDAALAREVAECASVVKGYGATHRRGAGQLRRLLDTILGAAVAGRLSAGQAADALVQARHAADADETGAAFDDTLASIETAMKPVRTADQDRATE